MTKRLYTIGHSNRKWDDFFNLLEQHQITHLIDIRAIPKSRFVPWSNQNTLEKKLTDKNIAYTHMPELGGRRQPEKDSINTAWKNDGFRGFADYMQTEDFYKALARLNKYLKPTCNVVIMCAEAVPWRCHRSLIADAVTVRKVNVIHIMTSENTKMHELTPFIFLDKSTKPPLIFYPDAQQGLDLLD